MNTEKKTKDGVRLQDVNCLHAIVWPANFNCPFVASGNEVVLRKYYPVAKIEISPWLQGDEAEYTEIPIEQCYADIKQAWKYLEDSLARAKDRLAKDRAK